MAYQTFEVPFAAYQLYQQENGGAFVAFAASAGVFGGYAPQSLRWLLVEPQRQAPGWRETWQEARRLLEVAAQDALARHDREVGGQEGNWPSPADFRPVSWRDFSGYYVGWAYGLGNTAALLVWRDDRPEPLWGVGWEDHPVTLEEVERLASSLRARLTAGRATLPAPSPVEEAALYAE